MLTSKRHQHFSSYISRLVDCPKKAKMSKIKDMLTTSNTGNDERMEVSQQSTPVENESTSPSSSSSATMTTRSTRRQRITINNMLQTTSTTTTTTTKSNYESDLAAMKEAIIRELAVEEQHVDVKQEAVDVLEEEMTDYYHQMQQQDDDDDEDDNGDDGEEGQGDEDVDFEPPLSPRDDCESSSRRRRYPVRNSPNRYNHRRINSNPHEESLSNEEESGVKIKPKIQIKLAISEKKERKRPGPQKKPKINEIIAIQNKQQRQNSPEPTDLEATGEDGKAKKSANYELLATARKLAKLEAVLHNNERRPGAPRRPKISEMICPNSEITQQELEQYQQQYQQHNDQEKQSKPDEQAANSNVINENPQEEVVESEPKRKKAGAPKRAKISEIVAAAEKAASLTQLTTNGTESGPIKCHLNKSSTERISDLIRSSTITSSQTTITTPVATNSQPAQLGESTAAATNKPTTNANSKMTRKIIDILTSQQQLQEQQQPFAGGRSNKVQQRENAVKSSASSESKSASDKILSKTPISQIMRAVNNNNGPLKPTATNLLEKRALPQPPPSTTTTKTQSTTTTTSSRKINNYLYGDDPEKRPTMNQGRLLISDILNRNNTNTNIQNTQQTGKSTISSMLTISMLNNNTITNSTNTCITASTLSVADNNTTSEPTKKRNVEDEGLEEGEVYVKSEPVVIERDENLERAHDLMMLSGAMICARCERCFVPSIEQLQQIQQQSSAAAGSSPLGNKINKMTTNDDYDNIGLCPDCSSCSKRNPKHN